MSAETVATGPEKGPRHVALIMDGNGRWAERRGLPRVMGHREGVQALRRTIKAAPDFGIRCLTVFGFSTEMEPPGGRGVGPDGAGAGVRRQRPQAAG